MQQRGPSAPRRMTRQQYEALRRQRRQNRIALAILDIELGSASGLELCGKLLEINPLTKVVFLTAYPDYSLDAWSTGAGGFMLKPLTPESVRAQLKRLRFPFAAGGADA